MTSEKPKHFIINCETGERTEVEFTDAEILEMQNNIERATVEQAEREAAEAAKANAKLSAEAKLAALGLTAEEIAALG